MPASALLQDRRYESAAHHDYARRCSGTGRRGISSRGMMATTGRQYFICHAKHHQADLPSHILMNAFPAIEPHKPSTCQDERRCRLFMRLATNK